MTVLSPMLEVEEFRGGRRLSLGDSTEVASLASGDILGERAIKSSVKGVGPYTPPHDTERPPGMTSSTYAFQMVAEWCGKA